MIDRPGLATGTAEVQASLRRSLAGDGVTAPLPAGGPEREQTLGMLRPDVEVTEPDAAAIVATSGSTGRPRGVVLSRSALVASATATHRRLGGPGGWVLALPVHYVAGLMVVVRALVAGQPVYEVDARLADLPDPAGSEPQYLSLVSTQLNRALRDGDLVRKLRRFAAVLVGGSAVDPELLRRAVEAGVPVVTTYGMSETCGGCVYDGRPLDGVEVTAAEDGRLSVAGPVLFSGYRLEPDATAAALVGGRLLTGDRGEVHDGRVSVAGRLDDVVVSGGMNVDLAAVERAARGATGADIAVVGLPDMHWGTRVVAIGNGVETLEDLQSRLRDRLPAYALPRQWIRLSQLPRTAGGKVDRQRLRRNLGSPP